MPAQTNVVDPSYTGMPKVTPKQALRLIMTHIQNGKPMFLHGAPGTGKTDLYGQACESLGYSMITKILTLDDVVELAGHYSVENGRTVRNFPDWLPSTSKTLILLDEFNTAEMVKQNAMLSFIRTGRIGKYTMPDECAIAMAGNRKTDGAHVSALSSATKNRVWHAELIPSVDDWIEWALHHGIYAPFIAWIKYSGLDSLYHYDPRSNVHAYPTGRSWENASDEMIASHDTADELDIVSGWIGEGEAVRVLGFVRKCRELINLDAVINNPENASVPTDANVLYMVAIGLSRRADRQNIESILKYVSRLGGEWETLAVLESMRITPALTTTPAFINYASNHNFIS
jgi:hypothetical protein